MSFIYSTQFTRDNLLFSHNMKDKQRAGEKQKQKNINKKNINGSMAI